MDIQHRYHSDLTPAERRERRATRARQFPDWLAADLARHREELARIERDARYSDGYRQELAAAERERARQAIKQEAASLWKWLGEDAAATRAELAAARERARQGIDWQQIAVRRDELGARLADRGNGFLPESPLRRALAIRQELVEAGDSVGLRALRLAAAPFLSAAGPDQVQALTDARRAFGADELDERDVEVDELVDLDHALQRAQAAYRESVLRIEREINPGGIEHGIFAGPSEWQRDVFGVEPERGVTGLPPAVGIENDDFWGPREETPGEAAERRGQILAPGSSPD